MLTGLVPDHEFVYRRIAWDHFANPRKAGATPMIAAFRPSKIDDRGLSVSVASLTTIEAIMQGRGRAYHVGRLPVGAIREKLGLTVLYDPLPDNAAHAVVPELAYPAYLANKAVMQAKLNRLVTDFLELVAVHLGPEAPDSSG